MSNILFDKELLRKCNECSWSFIELYSNREQFMDEFVDYNNDINDIVFNDFSVFYRIRIIVSFYGVAHDGEYREVQCEILRPCKSEFSFIDIMYELNNKAYAYLKECDIHFFEGFAFIESDESTLSLSMRLGS